MSGSDRVTLTAVLALLALVAGCTRPAGPRAVAERDELTVENLRIVRDYEVEIPVAEPQAEWDPNAARFVTRSVRGLMLVGEASGPRYFRTDDAFSPWEPRWTLDGDVVYGPKPEPIVGEEGQVHMPAHGLFIAAASGGSLDRPRVLTDTGYRPRPWHSDEIIATIGNQIVVVDDDGEHEALWEGFLAEPQRGGPGLAWQETPVFHRDWWTGIEGIGDLVIRWRPGVIDVIPRAVQARWTPSGGVVATVLRGEVRAGAPWHLGGTDVVHIAGPGAPVRILRRDARDPDPHPYADLVAVVGVDGRVHLVDYAGEEQRPIAETGSRPRWSGDGRRLLVQEKHPDRADAAVIRVYVFTAARAGEEAIAEQ